MSYLVFCTFDLKSGSSQDYQNAYADLAKLGLQKVHKADNGNSVVIPTTSAMGVLEGQSAAEVRDRITNAVQTAFSARKFKSEIFLTVGGTGWGWGARTT